MRVLDEAALKKHVADFPDFTQNERAMHFGISAISPHSLRDIDDGTLRGELVKRGYNVTCEEKTRQLG